MKVLPPFAALNENRCTAAAGRTMRSSIAAGSVISVSSKKKCGPLSVNACSQATAPFTLSAARR